MRQGEQLVVGCIVIEKYGNRYKVMHNSPTLGLHVIAFSEHLCWALRVAKEWN